jgi:outer membrane murein-binding lipoprotein Lpp
MRTKIYFPVIVSVAMMTTFLGGCRSTDEYKKLAKAGTNYSNALDQLLDIAVETRIDESYKMH